MTLKEKIDSIKKLVFGEETAQVALADMPLADGRTMQCDPACEVGAKCTIDGQPAPDGEYPCADGMVCVVAGGVITEIKPAEAAPEGSQADMSADVSWLKEQVQALIGKFVAQTQELNTAKAAFAAQKSLFEKTLKETLSLVEELSNQPAAEPAEKKPSAFKANKPDPASKAREIASVIKNLNQK